MRSDHDHHSTQMVLDFFFFNGRNHPGMRCSLTSQGNINRKSNGIQPKMSQGVADTHSMFSTGIQANHALLVTLPAACKEETGM